MKAAAYNLVKVEINQIDKIVEIKWVAPKVLENEHLTVIGKKLS